MNVKELNQNQLTELKQDYFYNHLTEDARSDLYCCYWEISNDIIYDFYYGVEFVNDDFFCSVDDYEPTAEYDSPENIEKCLNCQKPDCDNCLKSINGV